MARTVRQGLQRSGARCFAHRELTVVSSAGFCTGHRLDHAPERLQTLSSVPY